MLVKKRSTKLGFNIVHKNTSWAIAQKKYEGLDLKKIEKHLESDECFVLKKGDSYLIYEKDGELLIEKMTNEDIYIIPAGTWHTNYLAEGGEVIIVENNDVTTENSSYRDLTVEEIDRLIKQIRN